MAHTLRSHHLAVAAAGLAGALAVPVWDVGVGWSVAAVALVTPVALRHSAIGGPDRWWRVGAGLAAGGLAGFAAVRSAGWLVALCLVTAIALTSYALTGSHTWRGLAGDLTALPRAGLGALVGGLRGAAPGTPRPDGGPRWLRPLLGVAAGVVLLTVFGALFRAADPAFDRLAGDWTSGLSVPGLVRAGLGAVIALVLALGALQARPAGPRHDSWPAGRRALRAVEWVAPLVMVDALFAVFVWLQLSTGALFGGQAHVLMSRGPDYADHARAGFAQLAGVTVLTLGVVAVLGRADRATPRDRALVRVLGGILCGLSLMVVVSALGRMLVYVDAYGFSGPRLLGFTAELWLGLVLLLVAAAGVRLRGPWLPRAVVGAAVLILLGVAAVNPDALMARTHQDRLDRWYGVDIPYLATLSADAVAELDRLPEPERSCALRRVAAELARPAPWYRWTLADERARAVLARHPLRPLDRPLWCEPVQPPYPTPTPTPTPTPAE